MPTRDLSHALDADATVYPGDPAVELAPAATHANDGYRVTEVRLGTHSGTHVDAPSHTEPEGRDLDEFDVGEFAFDARLVDCSDFGAREAIGPEGFPDDLDAENDSKADLLVLRTGWDAHWGTDRYFDHPYLTREAAKWCADRGYHVALDTLSPDPSPNPSSNPIDPPSSSPDSSSNSPDSPSTSTDSSPSAKEEAGESSSQKAPTEPDGVPAHHELLGSGRFVLENLTGLADLPERFELRAYPLALAEADGSPVRAVAIW